MRVLVGIVMTVFLTPVLAATTTQYTALFQDKPAGTQTTRVDDDGTEIVDFSYRNNGRGPDLKERYEIAPDRTLLTYSGQGKSEMGAPIEDSFRRDDGAARWESTSDRGTAPISKPSMYVPVQPSPEVYALIVRAALAQPGHHIAALPGGELSVEKLRDELLQSNGTSRELSLYSISGLDVEPVYVWLTRGETLRLFAWIYPGWLHLVEAGWEAHVGSLEASQREAMKDQLKQLATRLRHPMAEPILIRNARVFDAERAQLQSAQDIYVMGGRIAAVYETGSTPQAAATVFDADGRVLMPALFDMHTHESDWDAVQQIAGGVTTVRDMGNDNTVLAELGQRIDRGDTIGPRIFPAGFIEGQSEFSARTGIVVSDLEGVKRAIDWYTQRGYRQIKIYNSFRPEWVPAATEYAHMRGLRVSGHVPAFMKAEDVVRNGFDEIQHINQVMLNFYVRPEDDTRTLTRFYLLAENAHNLDLDSPKVHDFVALLQQRSIVIDPTLAVFEGGWLP